MLFILLTLSFMLGSLLASAVSVFILYKLFTNEYFMEGYIEGIKEVAEKWTEKIDEIV